MIASDNTGTVYNTVDLPVLVEVPVQFYFSIELT